jgi:hypothetical protein
MYVALAAVGAVILGAGLGVILAMARRRLEQDREASLVRGDAPEQPKPGRPSDTDDLRPSLLGTPELRLRAMWLGVAFAALGVILLMAGGAFVGELMFLIGLMVTLQTTILAGMARLRGLSADAPSDS